MEIQSFIEQLGRVDKVLVVDKNKEITASEFIELIKAASSSLSKAGISDGTPVLINLNNDVTSVVMLFAAWVSGAMVFVGNPFNPVESVIDLVKKFKIFSIVGKNASVKALQYEMISEEVFHDDDLRLFKLGQSSLITIDKNRHDFRAIDESIAEAAVAIFSSGSTGEPKAIVNSFSHVYENALSHAEAIGLKASDTVGCVLPIFYSYGLVANLLSALAVGSKVVLHASTSAIDNEWVNDHQVSVIALTPFFAKDIVISSDHLRVMTLGGDALDIRTAKNIRRHHPQCELYSTYGLTEAGPRVATWRFDNCELPPHRVAPLGKPLSCCEIYLDKPNNTSHGELVVETRTRMLGYYYGYDQGLRMPDWREQSVHTGDLFEEVDGNYFFFARDKDIIVQNGEKIFPAVIESLLHGMDKVIDARVVGLKDAEKGEVAEAFIHASEDIGEEEVRRYLLAHLPHSSMPTHYHLVDQIKRSETGKRMSKSHFIEYREKILA